jgi:hypothetical protein
MKKKDVRPIYSELQGYLSQAPKANKSEDTISDKALWLQYNDTVNILSKITEEDYSRFRIEPIQGQYANFIRINTYRQKLGGLISRLHGEYFSAEPPPFIGMPSTVITQTQQQVQSFSVILLDMQDKINEQIQNYDKGSEERKFLDKLKDSLRGITNVTQLFNQLFMLAKQFGLSIEQLERLFG